MQSLIFWEKKILSRNIFLCFSYPSNCAIIAKVLNVLIEIMFVGLIKVWIGYQQMGLNF